MGKGCYKISVVIDQQDIQCAHGGIPLSPKSTLNYRSIPNTFAKIEITLTPLFIGISLTPAYFSEGIDIVTLTTKFPETMRVFEELCGNVNHLQSAAQFT